MEKNKCKIHNNKMTDERDACTWCWKHSICRYQHSQHFISRKWKTKCKMLYIYGQFYLEVPSSVIHIVLTRFFYIFIFRFPWYFRSAWACAYITFKIYLIYIFSFIHLHHNIWILLNCTRARARPHSLIGLCIYVGFCNNSRKVKDDDFGSQR